jgi:hypothetical protein
MNKLLIRLFCVFLCALTFNAEAKTAELKIFGWVETVFLPGPGLWVTAKLDTGAETSSLDARIIKKFRKGGRRWVRFVMSHRDTEEEHILVQERVRTISVVQHDGSRQSRPVVLLEVCLGGRKLKTEVSLIDRSEFNYPLLLGRTALASFALVDSGSTFLGQPDCESEVKPGEKP